MFIIEFLGWLGMAVVLTAFMLISLTDKLVVSSWIYQAANLVGSVFVLVNNVAHGAWPGVVLNVVWGVVAAIALIRTVRKK